jgi:ribosomal protein S18 acetylase RimI-like enzyme
VVTVRRARQADAAAMAAIARDAYAPYLPRLGRAPAPMTSDYAEVAGGGQAWVATAAGQVVGLLVLVPLPGYLLLENVAVHPDQQGRGIGSRLLAAAERQARMLGVAEIRLYTNEAMTENLAWYRRHGYTETHRADQAGYRRVFFAKRLDRPQA